MNHFPSFRNFYCPNFGSFIRSCFRFCQFEVNPIFIRLCYFMTLSLVGFLALAVSKTKTDSSTPKKLDFFFTSVSASTVSSMSTVEMEVFSNSQLVIMIILMSLGGEVFVSLLGLQFMKSNLPKNQSIVSNPPNSAGQVELAYLDKKKPDPSSLENNIVIIKSSTTTTTKDDILKNNSIKILSYVVLGYLLVIHIGGFSLVSLYVSLVPSARQVLDRKRLLIRTFSVFTTVSTFSNCGFVPTNENMIAFKKNSGLLLILIPLVLLGNTLYPTCLRFVIWGLEKTTKRGEFEHLLRNRREIGYYHLLSGIHSSLLGVTVVGLILLQWTMFCSLEWYSDSMDGLNSYQKLVASLFTVINSRYAGESTFDLSLISPAILVLFVVMMYLPLSFSFLPVTYRESDSKDLEAKENEKKTFSECLICSQLSYLTIFIILVCITERQKMKADPLNFNVFNIIIEVISAYGNVGFSSGYSCKRRLRADGSCIDKSYGFVGRWSNQGKLILIFVMFFGRIKLFNLKGGKAWKLS